MDVVSEAYFAIASFRYAPPPNVGAMNSPMCPLVEETEKVY